MESFFVQMTLELVLKKEYSERFSFYTHFTIFCHFLARKRFIRGKTRFEQIMEFQTYFRAKLLQCGGKKCLATNRTVCEVCGQMVQVASKRRRAPGERNFFIHTINMVEKKISEKRHKTIQLEQFTASIVHKRVGWKGKSCKNKLKNWLHCIYVFGSICCILSETFSV